MPEHRRNTRNTLSAVLVAVSCLLLPFGALAAWAAYGLTDTGRYVDALAPLADDPAVRDAVTDTVGGGLMDRVRLDAATRATARDTGVAEAGVRDAGAVYAPAVYDAVRSFTRTRAFRTAWDAGNRSVHEAVVRAVRDDGGKGDDDGPVTVDLAPIAAEVKGQLARDQDPLARYVPVRHTEVAVMPAEELARFRQGFRLLDIAGFWLPVTAAVLALAGITLAACRRRAVTATALGAALGGGCLALAVAVGRRLTLADLPQPAHRPAVGAVYDALTATLRTVSWLLVAVGVTVALACWLTGLLGSRPRDPSGLPAAPAADPAGSPLGPVPDRETAQRRGPD